MPSDDSAERTSPLQDDLLAEVVDRYLEELADGKSPDQSAYVEAHPEMADALRGVFKTLDLVQAAGKSLNASNLESGQRLGEFRIVREIGRGGMGVVYEAVQTSLGRRVALKVLPASVTISENALERFHREAHTGGRLHHTSIVPVYAVGEENGINYYAMQLIEGRSLSHYLKTARESPRSVDRNHFKRIAKWGRQAADALAHAHGQGIIHRDIKPANMLYDGKDNVWIFDFGLARASDDPTITQSGDLLGTVRYMSPEQARSESHLDGLTDVYSLGATLYELASLSPAFEGDSRATALRQVTEMEPRPLRQLAPLVPRDIETIVQKCMQKDRSRRYQSAADVAEDLRRFLAGEPILARRTPLSVRAWRWVRRHRGLSASLVAAIVLAIGASLLAAKLRHDEGRRRLQEAYTAIVMDQDFTRGTELLQDAESRGVDSAELYLYRGLIPMLNEQPQRALPDLEKARELASNDLNALYATARAHVDMGDFNSSKHLFEEEGSRRPASALGWFLRGYAQSRIQESEAIACYNRALEVQPDFVAAIVERATYRGFRLTTEGLREELEPMLRDFDAVAVMRPGISYPYAWRAWSRLIGAAYAATQPDLQEQGLAWLQECRADLGEALRVRRPDDPRALSVSGAYLRYIGDFHGSAKAYNDAMKIHRRLWGKPNLFYLHATAIALHAEGRVDAALGKIVPDSRATPEFYSLVLHRAILLAELGRFEEARSVCLEAAEHQKSHGTATFIIAAIMEFLGYHDDARAAIRGFETRDPEEMSFEYMTQTTGGAELEYLAGRIDADALMAAAEGNPGRRCEYAFRIAMRELGRGHREAGLAMLNVCDKTGVVFYIEHRFTRVFLERAKNDPQWPRWIKAANTTTSPGSE
ncbi:MAG: protein kinase [Planctomycetota bacterium]